MKHFFVSFVVVMLLSPVILAGLWFFSPLWGPVVENLGDWWRGIMGIFG
jgi:hypothetical protein